MCFCVFSIAHHFNIVRIAVAAFDFPIRNHLQKPQGATVAASQILYAQQVCLMLNKESHSRIAPLCNGVFKTFDNTFVVRKTYPDYCTMHHLYWKCYACPAHWLFIPGFSVQLPHSSLQIASLGSPKHRKAFGGSGLHLWLHTSLTRRCNQFVG